MKRLTGLGFGMLLMWAVGCGLPHPAASDASQTPTDARTDIVAMQDRIAPPDVITVADVTMETGSPDVMPVPDVQPPIDVPDEAIVVIDVPAIIDVRDIPIVTSRDVQPDVPPDVPVDSGCGAARQVCCPGAQPCGSGTTCVAGTPQSLCEPCGAPGDRCCGDVSCNSPAYSCVLLPNHSVHRCVVQQNAPMNGTAGNMCTSGACVTDAIYCDSNNYCLTCGVFGQICCAANTCNDGSTCTGGGCT